MLTTIHHKRRKNGLHIFLLAEAFDCVPWWLTFILVIVQSKVCFTLVCVRPLFWVLDSLTLHSYTLPSYFIHSLKCWLCASELHIWLTSRASYEDPINTTNGMAFFASFLQTAHQSLSAIKHCQLSSIFRNNPSFQILWIHNDFRYWWLYIWH